MYYYIYLINFLGDNLNHSKIILVAFISAFVAITTAVLGVAGTIIGSVLSSVLYNVLSEILEKPVTNAKFPKIKSNRTSNFEWDIAYVFPLVVILFIQLMLILAFLSEWGFLPRIFLNIYLSIQGVASNNLYRILGFSLIVMSVYPFILRRGNVKKYDGLIVLIIGLIFLARGFSDSGLIVAHTLDRIFDFVDFPISLIAFLLLIYVINSILSSARESKHVTNVKKIVNEKDLDDLELQQVYRRRPRRNPQMNDYNRPIKNPKQYNRYPDQSRRKINESGEGFHFESNDLLDDYKK